MGKRLYRFTGTDIPGNKDRLLNREVDLVLSDKSTIHGKLVSFFPDRLFIKNLRKQKHEVPFSRIREIIFDQEAPF